MSDVLNFPTQEPPELFIGPFSEHRVVVEGRLIPFLTGSPNGERPGEVSLTIDRRFSISIPQEVAYQVAWLLAQGMAVASGYAYLGSETKERPFAPKCSKLTPPSA